DAVDAVKLDHAGFHITLSAAVHGGRASVNLVLPRSVMIAMIRKTCWSLVRARDSMPGAALDLAEIERRLERPEPDAPAEAAGPPSKARTRKRPEAKTREGVH